MRRTILGTLILTAVLAWSAVLANAAAPVPQAATTQIAEGPTVDNVTDKSAEVKWKTNVQSSSVVRYGTDPNNLDKTAQAAWGGTEHRVTLPNLQPNTRYYVRVRSGQGQGTGTGAVSARISFMTRGGQAAAEQAQSEQFRITQGPTMEYVDNDSAILAWSTNVDSSTVVRYGMSWDSMTQEGKAPWGGTTHRVELKNLRPSTTYFFRVHSGQARGTGQRASSEVWSFQTTAQGEQPRRGQPAVTAAEAVRSSQASSSQVARITHGPVVEQVSDNSAVIAWSTNVKSSSVVRYGESMLGLNRTAEAPWGDTTHRVTISGLKPNTRYYFRVASAQAQGTGSQTLSRVSSFETVAPGAQAIRR